MAIFNLSNTASATDVTNINTQITGINSDITDIKNKTDKLTVDGTGVLINGKLQSTGPIISADDITGFGTTDIS